MSVTRAMIVLAIDCVLILFSIIGIVMYRRAEKRINKKNKRNNKKR